MNENDHPKGALVLMFGYLLLLAALWLPEVPTSPSFNCTRLRGSEPVERKEQRPRNKRREWLASGCALREIAEKYPPIGTAFTGRLSSLLL